MNQSDTRTLLATLAAKHPELHLVVEEREGGFNLRSAPRRAVATLDFEDGELKSYACGFRAGRVTNPSAWNALMAAQHENGFLGSGFFFSLEEHDPAEVRLERSEWNTGLSADWLRHRLTQDLVESSLFNTEWPELAGVEWKAPVSTPPQGPYSLQAFLRSNAIMTGARFDLAGHQLIDFLAPVRDVPFTFPQRIGAVFFYELSGDDLFGALYSQSPAEVLRVGVGTAQPVGVLQVDMRRRQAKASLLREATLVAALLDGKRRAWREADARRGAAKEEAPVADRLLAIVEDGLVRSGSALALHEMGRPEGLAALLAGRAGASPGSVEHSTYQSLLSKIDDPRIQATLHPPEPRRTLASREVWLASGVAVTLSALWFLLAPPVASRGPRAVAADTHQAVAIPAPTPPSVPQPPPPPPITRVFIGEWDTFPRGWIQVAKNRDPLAIAGPALGFSASPYAVAYYKTQTAFPSEVRIGVAFIDENATDSATHVVFGFGTPELESGPVTQRPPGLAYWAASGTTAVINENDIPESPEPRRFPDTVTPGQRTLLEIERAGTSVKYFVNEKLVHTDVCPSTGPLPLLLGFESRTANASIKVVDLWVDRFEPSPAAP